MKILVLFSGSLRTLSKNLNILKNKFSKNNIEYDIYLYNSHDIDDNYNSQIINFDELFWRNIK